MIHEVVDIWLRAVSPLKQANLLTQVYGLVRPGKISVDGKLYTVPKLHTSPEFEECSSVDEGLLINSNERAVLFVQGDTAVPIPTRSFRKFSALLKVVIWYDENKFITTENSSLSGAFLARLLDFLELGKKGNQGTYTDITWNTTKILEGWRAFQEYNFSEETGYLKEPYRSIAIEGNLTFYLNKYACQDAINIIDNSSNC